MINEDRDRLDLVATQGYGECVQVLWEAGQQALFFEHQDQLTRADPDLAARIGAELSRASAVLPMVLADQPLGQQAAELVGSTLGVDAPYHEFEGETFKLRTWSGQLTEAVLELSAGVHPGAAGICQSRADREERVHRRLGRGRAAGRGVVGVPVNRL